MPSPVSLSVALWHCFVTATLVLLDLIRLVTIGFRARRGLAAENLFLRKQLALFQERKVKPRQGRRCHSVDYGDSQPDVRLA